MDKYILANLFSNVIFECSVTSLTIDMAKAGSFKVGRSAKTGRFVKVSYANKHKNTTVVETIKKSS